MPFTPAHAAIVLPLSYLPKKYISLSALVVGSMAPDFEYFIRMKPYSIYSHTFAGLFWFDIPLGCVLLILFNLLVKNAVINHLPSFLYKRLARYKNTHSKLPSLSQLAVIVICLLTGAVSHLL